MKTKLLIIALIVSISSINSQNLLKSLYNLESFPEEMEKSKAFIAAVCSDILIYNYIFGGHGHSQFDMRSKDSLEIKLPLLNGFSLSFPNKTKEEINSYTFHVDYQFNYTRFYDEFKLNPSTFSLASIFDLATKYYDLDEYSSVNRILSNYKPELDYNTKRLEFFEILSQALKLETVPNFNTLISDDDNESLLNREVEELMLDAILKEYDYETINAQLFNYFILDKNSSSKTRDNLKQIFNNNTIIEEIESEILQPKITIGLYQAAFLNIPRHYVTVNEAELKAFPINSITTKIDYKNHLLIIDFTSNKAVNLSLNNVSSHQNAEEVQTTSKHMRLLVSESDLKLQIFKFNPYKSIKNTPFEIHLDH